MRLNTFALTTLFFYFSIAYYDIDDSLLYKIEFPGPLKNAQLSEDGKCIPQNNYFVILCNLDIDKYQHNYSKILSEELVKYRYTD